jgi:hypothetical protein
VSVQKDDENKLFSLAIEDRSNGYPRPHTVSLGFRDGAGLPHASGTSYREIRTSSRRWWWFPRVDRRSLSLRWQQNPKAGVRPTVKEAACGAGSENRIARRADSNTSSTPASSGVAINRYKGPGAK